MFLSFMNNQHQCLPKTTQNRRKQVSILIKSCWGTRSLNIIYKRKHLQHFRTKYEKNEPLLRLHCKPRNQIYQCKDLQSPDPNVFPWAPSHDLTRLNAFSWVPSQGTTRPDLARPNEGIGEQKENELHERAKALG